MRSESLIRRACRKCWSFLPKKLLSSFSSWRFLAFYPVIKPTDTLLQNWNSSHWEEYQKWLSLHAWQNLAQWEVSYAQRKQWLKPPKISIVTPVFNTEPAVLYECILSVRMQSYPFWQWILVDDASSRTDTKQLLASGVCADPRIQVIFGQDSRGISGATNCAIAEAAGDFVVFLDHDDRLDLEALAVIAAELDSHPELDIVYSDRDMLSEQGERYLHLFKPNWSPETLLSGNYIFHLMAYRRQLLLELGGLRSEFDGSQDYDLILRAAELHPQVAHIPKILYHWRQHSASVALNVNAKDYAFQAGIAALNAALQRRGISGQAQEIPGFWRGTYQLDLATPETQKIHIIWIPKEFDTAAYAQFISNAIAKHQIEQEYIAIFSEALVPKDELTITRLAAWLLNFDELALASAKIVTPAGALDYVGTYYNQDTSLMFAYQGFPESEPGYMGVSQIVRNISAPHPGCVIFKRSWWERLQGFRKEFLGPHALLDFALRAQDAGGRSVIVPQCVFVRQQQDKWLINEKGEDFVNFHNRWASKLQFGDPYYNVNLAQYSRDMGLDI